MNLKKGRYSPKKKILSVTCDNASNNDTMINHLAEMLKEFPGEANRTRCFTHILNLVARCIMRQFDDPKKSKRDAQDGDNVDDLADALAELDDELENDEGRADEAEGEETAEWIPDGREDMTEAEIRELEESVKPVRRVLTKVGHSHILVTLCSFIFFQLPPFIALPPFPPFLPRRGERLCSPLRSFCLLPVLLG